MFEQGRATELLAVHTSVEPERRPAAGKQAVEIELAPFERIAPPIVPEQLDQIRGIEKRAVIWRALPRLT